MPSTTTLLSRLRISYPQFSFKLGDDFLWSSSDNTIYYNDDTDNQPIFLLHELSHALLGHANYDSDIQLMTMERQAWDCTVKLALSHDLTIPEQIIQSNLDSYRDWLHARSTCPGCGATGLQTKECNYKCSACSHEWQVNEARTCALRRYTVKT
jgi:hypothetical protein